MKKLFSYACVLAVAALGMTACNGGNNTPATPADANEEAFKNIITPYVDNTVIATYRSLGDATVELYEAVETMFEHFEKGSLTEADIKAAADEWVKARRYWELSEAFLYGPAGDYSIDPHIDSWPLAKDEMDALLGDATRMQRIEEDGADYVGNFLGYGLLGFHAIEYMLYAPDNADKSNVRYHSTAYTRPELVYTLAVTEDLMLQTLVLEASWAGIDNVSKEKRELLEEAELENRDFAAGYASLMKNAQAPYSTYKAAVEELVQGCIDIADEVGNTKIGTPANASSEEDRNYIESPYALNSIEDFQDNIRSIQNAYLGSNAGDACLSDIIKQRNADLDARCREALENSIKAIAAIPEPFAANAKSSEAQNAVKVVGTDLVDVLEEIYNEVGK